MFLPQSSSCGEHQGTQPKLFPRHNGGYHARGMLTEILQTIYFLQLFQR